MAFGVPPSQNPPCSSGSDDLADGHYSFPSGHASTVFAVATFSAAYCLWAFMGRGSTAGTAQQWSSSKAGGLRAQRYRGQVPYTRRLLADLVAALCMLWVLAQMIFAWVVVRMRKRANANVILVTCVQTAFK